MNKWMWLIAMGLNAGMLLRFVGEPEPCGEGVYPLWVALCPILILMQVSLLAYWAGKETAKNLK